MELFLYLFYFFFFFFKQKTAYEIVKGFWQQESSRIGISTDFETWWRQSIHDGFIPNSAFNPKTVSFNANFANQNPVSQPATSGYELVYRPDPSIYDGRFANNGWLQE